MCWFRNYCTSSKPWGRRKWLGIITFLSHRAVFKWLSKVITWLRLLRLLIGLKDSRQFFNQWETKPKPTAPCTRDFSRASSKLQVIARNCDWFIALFVPIVIGRSNCFGFSTVIWKPLYPLRKANATSFTYNLRNANLSRTHWEFFQRVLSWVSKHVWAPSFD